MSPEKHRPSKGWASHIRKEKAAQRKVAPSPTLLEKTMEVRDRDRMRLHEEIPHLLSDESLDGKTRAALEIEKYCLQFKLGEIPLPTRMSKIDKLLNTLEDKDPDIYLWLMDEIRPHVTRISDIVNRVIPRTPPRR